MSTTTANTVECRQPKWSDKPLYWAFDYETFVKLRKLHKWYYQNLHLIGHYKRWIRKEPQNRKGPKPEYFRKDLGEFAIFCQEARMPYNTEEEAMEVRRRFYSLSTKVDEMYEEASKFFEK